LDVILNNSSGQPFYEQIVQQVKRLIQTGRLQEGDPLPSMRQLAKDLRVSVITTKRAYEELEQAGYLCSVAGRGSFAAHPGRDQVRREQDQRLDQHLEAAAAIAREAGIPRQQLLERLGKWYEEEN
jgi:GntR family transcriptional regulator